MNSPILPPNAWADRYTALLNLNDDDLRLALATHAVPLVGLQHCSPEGAAGKLWACLNAIFVPTDQSLYIVRRFIGRAQAYALVRYPSIASFASGIYDSALEFEPWPSTAMTGIAGVGKSQLGKAIGRVVAPPGTLILPDKTQVPLIGMARLSVDDKSTERALRADLLRQFGASIQEQHQKSMTPELVRRRAYVSGCCQILIDEMQFKNQGNASAAVTKVLLALTHLGPPLTFVANFSLLHKLLNRNHEDRERLLSDVVVIHPDAPDAPSLTEMLTEWRKALSRSLDIAPDVDAGLLDRLSGGSKRAMRNLVVAACRNKWEESRAGTRQVVTARDVEAAFRSPGLAALRETTRLLMAQRITGKPADAKRLDVWCPIQSAEPKLTPLQDRLREAAEVARNKEMGSAALRSQMTPAELKKHDEPQKALEQNGSPKKSRGKKKRAAGATYEGLLLRVKTHRL